MNTVWQQYVDRHLVGTRQMRHGAILGLNGSTWGASAGFAVRPDEGRSLALLLGERSIAGRVFTVGGARYTAGRCDPHVVHGTNSDSGLVALQARGALVVGVYDGRDVPERAREAVEKLARRLLDDRG
ncbi:profilin [Streptantibioticus cattleyicolor]|uniref:Chain A, Acanthamoeba Castellanii Profilin Ib n=1 Tax=Streptantibioticus cattleyicolor (strain ATCC 35852 / DSM 46488 / JCM 4925 / NBRC 14057 / NRRL 8057) TaxID=1003195 RepID=F8JM16_STREN|nr:profilin [Streptantibioticus cattleyicolor]AEW99460.1 Chain A, Acanthamoeba Castellanii Profilin Ib' [Streptantibioticus cattleyicolor NRRL 8057 = DSM 46488]CCB71498.1 putative Profilin-1A [Streptantibioticus cattleyicolor NRRL 8057 = DSM 46488]